MAKTAKKKSKKVAARKTTSAKKPAAKARPLARNPAAGKKPAKKVAKKAAKHVAAKPPKKTAAKKVAKKIAKHVTAKAPKKLAKKSARPKNNGASRVKSPRPSPHVRKDGGRAFLPEARVIGHKRVRDDLAEELGEEFVSSITSGESVDDARDAPVTEEEGGPFVTTSAGSQYGRGTDASNPADAEREPFPTTHSERR